MRPQGFTLAELLIALAILGVIATFTIPKVLNSSQNGQYNSMAKEAIGAVSQAIETYKATQGNASTATFADLSAYLNYISIDTVTLALKSSGLSDDCSIGARICLRLANNGLLWSSRTRSFGGNNPTNVNFFYFNPDPDTPNVEAVSFWIFYNGRLTTIENLTAPACHSGGCVMPAATPDPSWFSWD